MDNADMLEWVDEGGHLMFVLPNKQKALRITAPPTSTIPNLILSSSHHAHRLES